MRATHRLLALTLPLALVLVLGCAHTPSPKEKKQADAEYNVGISLVHEAQRAAIAGDLSQQDLKYRLALESLLKAHKLDAGNSEVNYLLGLVYFSGFKRHVESEQHLRLALEGREEYPEADNLLGTVLVDAGRPAEAIPFFERARSNLLYKTPYYSESELGWAYYKLGDADRGARHLNNALTAQPDLCGAYVKLAEVEESRANTAGVQRVLDRFVERCDSERLRNNCGPDLLAWGYWRLGMSRLKAGDNAGAAEALRVCSARFKSQAVAAECDRSLRLIE
jgi:Tfp pilus assembly protein PilF